MVRRKLAGSRGCASTASCTRRSSASVNVSPSRACAMRRVLHLGAQPPERVVDDSGCGRTRARAARRRRTSARSRLRRARRPRRRARAPSRRPRRRARRGSGRDRRRRRAARGSAGRSAGGLEELAGGGVGEALVGWQPPPGSDQRPAKGSRSAAHERDRQHGRRRPRQGGARRSRWRPRDAPARLLHVVVASVTSYSRVFESNDSKLGQLTVIVT